MNEIIPILNSIINGETIQNANAVIGHELQMIISSMQKNPSSVDDFPDFEELFFSLINSRTIHLSSVVSNSLGICLALYYQTHKISHWKFISIINDSISRSSVAGIVVLGIVARHSTEGIKSQLPSLITSMLQINKNSMQPFICQCFRRIIKGTGTFITKSITDIFSYITKHMNNPSIDSMKIECFRTISALFIYSKISIDKILPLLNQMLQYSTSYTHRYAAAKSLASIGFDGCSKDVELANNTKGENINPFQFFFKLIFDLSPRDSSIPTISSSFVIFLRFFEPIFVIENLRYLLNFVIDFTSLKSVSLTSLSSLSISVFNAVVRSAGESISTSICNLTLEQLKDKVPNGGLSTVALTIFVHFTFMSKLSSSIITTIAKSMYSFLSATRSDIRRLATAFFAVLAQKDPAISALYYKTFVDFLNNLSKAKEHEVDGFSRAVVYNVIYGKIDENEILNVCIQMLKNGTFIPYSFMILAAIQKRRATIQKAQYIEIFQYIEKCTKTPKGMKYASLFVHQIILSKVNSKFTELNQYIIQYITSFIQNCQPLKYSSPTYLTFLNIVREASSMVKQIPNLSSSVATLCVLLVNKFITAEIADQLHPFAGQIDQVNELYNVKVPPPCATTLDSTSQTIYQVFLDISNSSSNRFNLIKEIDNSFSTWLLLADNSNKASIISSLFAQSKSVESNLGKIVLIRTLLTRPKLTSFLPNDGLPFILNFEASNNRVLQRYAATTAARWLKLHPELADACYEYLEKPTRSVTFACTLFAELSKGLDDPSRCILIIMNIMKKQPLTSPLFAISFLLKNCGEKISNDVNLSAMVMSLLNKSAFSDYLRNPSAMVFYKNCFFHLKSVHPSVIFSLMNFPVFRNFAMLQGLELLKVMNPNECFQFKAKLINLRSSSELSLSSQDMTKQTNTNSPSKINSNENINSPSKVNPTENINLPSKVNSTENMNSGDVGLDTKSNLSFCSGGLVDGLLLKGIYVSKHLPHMILAHMYKYTDTIEDVPGMFTLLQQTHLTIVSESLLRSVSKFPDLKFWTDMCKRVVLNKCVPPAERKNEIRVLPTRVVLIVAMKVVVKLVNKIRELFPLELNCVDDIVSIAFNSVQINDRKVDFHSFSILAAVLRAFIDVRNRDGALLNTYLAQFHPMLRHALDGTRAIKNVAAFVIAYLNFLAESENQLLSEALKITQKGLLKTENSIISALKAKQADSQFNIETFVTFCRIKCRLLTLCNEGENESKKMEKITVELIRLICENKCHLSDLEDELTDFVSISMPIVSNDVKKLIFLLLISDLSRPAVKAALLSSLTILLDDSIEKNDRSFITDEELKYVILLVAKNRDYFISSLDNDDNTQLFDDTDSLDTNFYWISKLSSKLSLVKKFNYLTFLTKVAQLIPINESWNYIFSLAIECRPICFSSLSVLLDRMKKEKIETFLPYVINFLPILFSYDNCLPFFVQLFDKQYLSVPLADQILKLVANLNLNEEKINLRKFEVLKYGLIQFGEFDLSAVDDICKFVTREGNLVPQGINFIASLLVDKKSAKIGLNILFNGVADSIVLSIPSSLNSLPRILHFFNLAYSKLNEVCLIDDFHSKFEGFEKSLISIVFFALKFAGNQKGKEAVVQPSLLILRKLNEEYVKEKFENDSRKSELIQSIKPPRVKKAAVIELKTFGNVKPSTATKWQTLEIEDDD